MENENQGYVFSKNTDCGPYAIEQLGVINMPPYFNDQECEHFSSDGVKALLMGFMINYCRMLTQTGIDPSEHDEALRVSMCDHAGKVEAVLSQKDFMQLMEEHDLTHFWESFLRSWEKQEVSG